MEVKQYLIQLKNEPYRFSVLFKENNKYYFDKLKTIEINLQDKVEFEIEIYSNDIVYTLISKYKEIFQRCDVLDRHNKALRSQIDNKVEDIYPYVAKMFDKYINESTVTFENLSTKQVTFITEKYISFIKYVLDGDNEYNEQWKEWKNSKQFTHTELEIKHQELFITYLNSHL